ncbi:MAG: TrkA family potassium uptake protein [Candidatus Thermoplasmatota archaeon]|nr:TrkA family potassium uptake protein [Candidatus Thermoplasmatota archaeon]
MIDIIICGYGVVGKRVASIVHKQQISYKIIDEKEIFDDDTLHIVGNAASEKVLKQAGIEKAKTIVAATDDDITNAFITLLARDLNKDIAILARVDEVENVDKLDKAGADYVFSMATAGRFIVKNAIEPFVADFLDMVNLKEGIEIMQVDVTEQSKITDRSIKKAKIWKRTGAHIIAIRREKETIYSPSGDEKIMPGDKLLAIGNGEQVKALHNLAEPEKIIEPVQK